MGIEDDRRRFEEIGEERREDLTDYIKYGELGGRKIKVPIKIVDLPEFVYDERDAGGIGIGDGDIGEPIDNNGNGEPGTSTAEHSYYEMNPEEFAKELDKELGLDLEPKGKTVVEEIEGAFTETASRGPESTLDKDYFIKQAVKRELALAFDEDYLRELLLVKGMGPRKAFEWARNRNIPVSHKWFKEQYDTLPPDEKTTYDSVDDIERERKSPSALVRDDSLPLRKEDKRYKHPDVIEKEERNAVIVNIRDVSGSMRDEKRELVERVFTPMDWYLQGKFEQAEFVYIAHDSDAWEVDRESFFGIRSGGGTKISSAYELANDILEANYPYSEWNRFVFAAGDGENSGNDSVENVVPLIEDIEANTHAYTETQPSTGLKETHGDVLKENFGQNEVVVETVKSEEDVIRSIRRILSTKDSSDTNE